MWRERTTPFSTASGAVIELAPDRNVQTQAGIRLVLEMRALRGAWQHRMPRERIIRRARLSLSCLQPLVRRDILSFMVSARPGRPSVEIAVARLEGFTAAST